MKFAYSAALRFSLICAFFVIPAQASTIVLENFTSPTTQLQGTGTAARTLGDTGTYSFGSWIYSSVGEINVSGSGVARIRNNTSQNARAISVIFSPDLFTAGTEYTVSFDVIGQASAKDTGRYWLAALSGYGAGSSVLTNVAPSGTWATATSPYTTSGSAQITFLGGMSNTGTLISGENTATTTPTSITFTYVAGTAIAFAVGTYDNDFAIDNFSIATAAIPEPSTYALAFGASALSLALYRRSRRLKAHSQA